MGDRLFIKLKMEKKKWFKMFNPDIYTKEDLSLICDKFPIYLKARKSENKKIAEETLLKTFKRIRSNVVWEYVFEKYDKLLNYNAQQRDEFFQQMLAYIQIPLQLPQPTKMSFSQPQPLLPTSPPSQQITQIPTQQIMQPISPPARRMAKIPSQQNQKLSQISFQQPIISMTQIQPQNRQKKSKKKNGQISSQNIIPPSSQNIIPPSSQNIIQPSSQNIIQPSSQNIIQPSSQPLSLNASQTPSIEQTKSSPQASTNLAAIQSPPVLPPSSQPSVKMTQISPQANNVPASQGVAGFYQPSFGQYQKQSQRPPPKAPKLSYQSIISSISPSFKPQLSSEPPPKSAPEKAPAPAPTMAPSALPDPSPDGHANEEVLAKKFLDNIKVESDFYSQLKAIYSSLHSSQLHSKSEGLIEYSQDKLDFQKDQEEKLMAVCKDYSAKYRNKFLYSLDEEAETIIIPSNKTTSKTRFLNRDTKHKTVSRESFVSQTIEVTSYIKLFEVRQFQFNEKVLSFIIGELQDDSCYCLRIKSIEAFTVVSFCLKVSASMAENNDADNDNDQVFKINVDDLINEFLFSHPAYVYYNESKQKHILNFFGIEVEMDFILPVKAIYFHRDAEDQNKLYIQGDIRVKEFTIFGLDNYIEKVMMKGGDDNAKFEMITIKNTNTFYFEGFQLKTAVIFVWKDELVLGCNSSLCFWRIDEGSKGKITVSQKEMSKQDKIDIDEFQGINSITSFQKTDLTTYLAVSSEKYPVILILNKRHQIVSRLVSHTLGITSLTSFGFHLFSSSLDQSVRIWDMQKEVTETIFSFKNEEITAIEVGLFCNELFLFTGSRNHKIYCWSIKCKQILFEIQLCEITVPRKIVFIAGNNKEKGEMCKLIVVSEYEGKNKLAIQIQFFQFV